MKRFICTIVTLLFFACPATLLLAQSAQLTGFVANGTTRKPAAGDDVIVLDLSRNMQEEGRTKTDAKGQFHITVANGNVPHLLRVRHQDVNYHETVQPGASSVQITVYDSQAKVAGVQVLDQSLVLETDGQMIRGIELFRVRNTSTPPVSQPTFEFYTPDGAEIRLGEGISGGPGGMPTKTAPIPTKEKNRYAFQFPIRPGVTQFELVFTMPYTGSLSLQPKFAVTPQSFYVVTAKGIDFSSPSSAFKSVPQWPVDPSIVGVGVHLADAQSLGQPVSFQIAGTGLLPQDQPQEQQGAAAGGGQQGAAESTRPGGGMAEPNDRPDPLHSGQWLFLGVLTLFLAAGGVYVYTSNAKEPALAGSKKAPAGGNLIMEAMKEEIFQLESDRLQGKISSQEYDSAKAAIDKTLKRAVQRQGSSK